MKTPATISPRRALDDFGSAVFAALTVAAAVELICLVWLDLS